ncbi:hypothetical protein ABH944_008542 [Caballeronia udeis]|uniref:Uncharacterized protein n=1 Tax=Caballeronia udeis TaxID=1232866 RepID=A0ABW8MXN9_9BURK
MTGAHDIGCMECMAIPQRASVQASGTMPVYRVYRGAKASRALRQRTSASKRSQ